MCGGLELEDSIDLTSIFKLQLVLLRPYLKRVAVIFLFIFVIIRKVYFAFFYNSLYAAEQILTIFTCTELKLLLFEEN